MEASPADHHDLERPVGIGRHLGDQGRAAGALDGVYAARADLVAHLDRHHTELPRRIGRQRDQVTDERPVAVLEDVERHHDPGEQHRVQREQRQWLTHVLNLTPDPRSAAPERLLRPRPAVARSAASYLDWTA